jgi:hypothetical protein
MSAEAVVEERGSNKQVTVRSCCCSRSQLVITGEDNTRSHTPLGHQDKTRSHTPLGRSTLPASRCRSMAMRPSSSGSGM